jgi:hypothetical protein
VHERQKSSTRVNTLAAPSRSSSAVDLSTGYDHGEPLERHASQPVTERRRPTVLGGFLKPLTRVDPVTVQAVSGSPTAPAMTRRATEDGTMERERRTRRSDTMDTSYRTHGW